MLLTSGCAAMKNAQRGKTDTPADAVLPANFQQARLAELLSYMADHGVKEAEKATIFEFTAWPMYRHPDWAGYDRKPRYEGAEFHHQGIKVIVAISPVLQWEGPRQIIQTKNKDDQVNGAALMLPGKTWNLSFTLEKPDKELQDRFTKMLDDFANS